ncbi:hypothetical protein [Bacillus massiliigorillae]|uniref:hypothetical protein n=1 Tax=Bacillus massiliigorillae TaxID=1243664 RepID=UPI00039D4290|nr:hypothetical protein [Bacillus massiliigorillae]
MIGDIQFLKDLQQELRTQENDCQASPRFWAIMDYKWVVTAEGHEDRISLFDSDACETVELNDYVDEILNGERSEDFTEDEIEELKDLQEFDSPNDVYSWIESYDDDSRFYPIYEEQVSFIAPNTMFLTKAEAKRHLELNHYHYSAKAHTYAMTAWRAPKVERLLKILETFDWNQIEQLKEEKSFFVKAYTEKIMSE